MKNKIDKNIDIKIEKEKKIVKLMIMRYCKGQKHSGRPCGDCGELIQYVEDKLDLCPFMETKTYCSNCKVHCYKASMRMKIKEVMRYSGPRMIFSHPIITIDHVYQGLKQKLK